VAPSDPAEPAARVRFPPPLVFVLWLLMGVALHHLVQPAHAPGHRAISAVAGILLLLIGLGLLIWARVHFFRTGQDPIPWTPSPELIFQGPYHFSRNPMYVGMTVFQLGFGVALSNLWIALFAFPALLMVHVTAVLPEERYLTGKFGESYRTYLAQVRRYL